MKSLLRLFGAPKVRQSVDLVPLAPLADEGQVVWAVGDVHGCLSLYRKLEAEILADARAQERKVTIVLLGDVVDRGPASAEVLDLLTSRPPEGLKRICLRGNHEDMMLQFLETPDPAADWLHFGGRETLMSYGVDGVEFSAMPKRKLEQFIRAIIPEQHIRFLRSLQFGAVYKSYVLVHAGVDPQFGPELQPSQTLMWGNAGEGFGPEGPAVVHGHVIQPAPIVTPQRVAIDTGAYKTGILTAAQLSSGYPPRILSVTDH